MWSKLKLYICKNSLNSGDFVKYNDTNIKQISGQKKKQKVSALRQQKENTRMVQTSPSGNLSIASGWKSFVGGWGQTGEWNQNKKQTCMLSNSSIHQFNRNIDLQARSDTVRGDIIHVSYKRGENNQSLVYWRNLAGKTWKQRGSFQGNFGTVCGGTVWPFEANVALPTWKYKKNCSMTPSLRDEYFPYSTPGLNVKSVPCTWIQLFKQGTVCEFSEPGFLLVNCCLLYSRVTCSQVVSVYTVRLKEASTVVTQHFLYSLCLQILARDTQQ